MARQVQYSSTGRRRGATARVRLVPGSGKITMNGKTIEDYIPFASLRAIVNQPLAVTKTEGQYDVLANANGSGFSGQAGAVRHGIAHTLLAIDPDSHDALKKAGLLTRDPRIEEHRKPGLREVRKAAQFGKR